jgi:hypothetical protein
VRTARSAASCVISAAVGPRDAALLISSLARSAPGNPGSNDLDQVGGRGARKTCGESNSDSCLLHPTTRTPTGDFAVALWQKSRTTRRAQVKASSGRVECDDSTHSDLESCCRRPTPRSPGIPASPRRSVRSRCGPPPRRWTCPTGIARRRSTTRKANSKHGGWASTSTRPERGRCTRGLGTVAVATRPPRYGSVGQMRFFCLLTRRRTSAIRA